MPNHYKYLPHIINMLALPFCYVNNTYGYGSVTGNLYVTAIPVFSCEVDVTNSVMEFDEFVKLDPKNTMGSAYSNVNIHCPAGMQYDIELDAGDNMLNNERMLSHDSLNVFYELFNDGTGEEWGPEIIGGEQLEDQLSAGKLQTYKIRADLYNFDKVQQKKGLDDLIEVTFVFD